MSCIKGALTNKQKKHSNLLIAGYSMLLAFHNKHYKKKVDHYVGRNITFFLSSMCICWDDDPRNQQNREKMQTFHFFFVSMRVGK